MTIKAFCGSRGQLSYKPLVQASWIPMCGGTADVFTECYLPTKSHTIKLLLHKPNGRSSNVRSVITAAGLRLVHGARWSYITTLTVCKFRQLYIHLIADIWHALPLCRFNLRYAPCFECYEYICYHSLHQTSAPTENLLIKFWQGLLSIEPRFNTTSCQSIRQNAFQRCNM